MINKDKEKTILVIDDELGPRESLKMVLKDDYRVILAENAEEGLKILKEVVIDAIILDIRMPGLNGIEALRRIKKINNKVEVILLTGYGSPSSAQVAVRLGALDYLSKPCEGAAMKKVVKNALIKSSSNHQAEDYLMELKELNQALKNELADSSHLVSAGRISAALLHEIKNPLVGILGYSELLLENVHSRKKNGEELPENFEKYLSIIRRETERCGRMSKKFLGFSTLVKEELQKSNLNQVITEGLEILHYQAMAKGITIATNLSNKLPQVTCQPDLVKQVFINLALNAVEAMPMRGRLTITSSLAEQGSGETGQVTPIAQIVFQDNGPGMNKKDQKSVFDTGYSKKPGGKKGNGWGLTISRQIIQEHNGQILIESSKQHGTTVTVLLPIEQTETTTESTYEKANPELAIAT